MSERVEDFYTQSAFKQPVLRGHQGNIEVEHLYVSNDGVYIGDSLPADLQPALAHNIERLYDSIKPHKVTIDGNEYTFEIGYIRGSGEDVELRAASYQSSLTENYGNGFEVASMATENPDKTIIYTASTGMGLSSAMTKTERSYLREYGRLLFVDDGVVKPLPVVQALGKAVFNLGFKVTNLGSDSAGALLTVAYGAAYGNGAIQSAHQNVRTGIVDKNPISLAKGVLLDDPKLSAEHSKASLDALRMSKEKLEFTKASISQEYRDKLYEPHKSVAMLKSLLFGLGRGPEQDDPLVGDNVAFARANPGADILFTVGRQDFLADTPQLDQRIREIVRFISLHSEGTISGAIIEGAGHGVQTHYPQFLRRLAKTALS